MNINIRGSKVEVTESIKSYVENKIGKLSKYFENPDDITANVVLKVRGVEQIVEVTIPVRKIILRGEETNKDLYAAIDLVSEKVERQIRKNKTRMKQKINKEALLDFKLDFDNSFEETEGSIVKRKELEMKPMDTEEAILQMNLLGHEFFVFKDTDTKLNCVLYKRKDGNYGIIELK